MTELKDAVRLANEYLAVLIPEAEASALEEVEKDEEEWLVTLSFTRPGPGPLGQFGHERTYKRFRVVDGAVVSMKIRELAGL